MSLAHAVLAALAAAALAGCGNNAPPWQLSHDRIIAVRATPPHIPPGATSTLDVFVAFEGSDVAVVPPETATVQSPTSLVTALVGATVTAPDATSLAQVRSELGLGSADPVPLEVLVEVNGFEALKTVYIGDSADNPPLDGLTVNGVAPPSDPATVIAVPKDTDVPLFVNADDSTESVVWLTSCGTMTDYNLHDAILHVKPDDPQSGQLAIVVRDQSGGATWQYWAIAAQ